MARRTAHAAVAAPVVVSAAVLRAEQPEADTRQARPQPPPAPGVGQPAVEREERQERDRPDRRTDVEDPAGVDLQRLDDGSPPSMGLPFRAAGGLLGRGHGVRLPTCGPEPAGPVGAGRQAVTSEAGQTRPHADGVLSVLSGRLAPVGVDGRRRGAGTERKR